MSLDKTSNATFTAETKKNLPLVFQRVIKAASIVEKKITSRPY
jgi:hypothetical protein